MQLKFQEADNAGIVLAPEQEESSWEAVVDLDGWQSRLPTVVDRVSEASRADLEPETERSDWLEYMVKQMLVRHGFKRIIFADRIIDDDDLRESIGLSESRGPTVRRVWFDLVKDDDSSSADTQEPSFDAYRADPRSIRAKVPARERPKFACRINTEHRDYQQRLENWLATITGYITRSRFAETVEEICGHLPIQGSGAEFQLSKEQMAELEEIEDSDAFGVIKWARDYHDTKPDTESTYYLICNRNFWRHANDNAWPVDCLVALCLGFGVRAQKDVPGYFFNTNHFVEEDLANPFRSGFDNRDHCFLPKKPFQDLAIRFHEWLLACITSPASKDRKRFPELSSIKITAPADEAKNALARVDCHFDGPIQAHTENNPKISQLWHDLCECWDGTEGIAPEITDDASRASFYFCGRPQ